ncbi:TrbI/VirB10 family protein [Sphingobium ummariense]|uniref:Conjugal transfer protein TrbI n=1 Tax=Sphingobium ummariense RL-3 TaxID=1346791 RepID=T0KJP0_9SPHN|nr:TrbI/VirB10 family protein [Sphingobium ummariense]EQB33553.1 hypothetical protein M529_03515 [Sphingobium ummariense RL-3]
MSGDITADPAFTPEEKQPVSSILETNRPGVTRYKRSVIIGIVSAFVAMFAIGIVYAFVIPKGGHAEKEEQESAIQTAKPVLDGLPQNYGDGRPDLSAPGMASLPADGAEGTEGQAPPNGQQSQQRQLTPAQQRAEQARGRAIQQEMAARAGGILFPNGGMQGTALGGAGDAMDGRDMADANSAQDDPEAPGRQNMQREKEQFIQSARIGEDYLPASVQSARSTFEVKAGAVIPAALVTAINSDLPGDVVATVTENVYDHATGRYLLIPQGARLFGRYDSKVSYKQNRALVVWDRIIYPNGDSINIGGMTGTDATGASGLKDRVNNHYGSLLTGITLSTAIAIGGAYADSAGTRDNQLVTAGGGAISQEASRTGQQFVTRELNRQPTITIRSGARLRVLVNKDMILRPYQRP